MKKLTCGLLIFAIVFSFAFGSGAAWADGWSRFEIKAESGILELEIDEEFWYVFTRDNLKNNDELDALGIDPELQAEFMDEEDVLLDALVFYQDSDAYVEMLVREVELNRYCDFSRLSDAQLEDLAEEMSDEFDSENGGVICTDNGLNFVNHEFYDGEFYVKEFLIAVGEKSFDILFQTPYPFIDEEYEEMEMILESIEFTPDPKAQSGNNSGLSSATDILESFDGVLWTNGLSRFELETGAGTLEVRMDEEFWYVFTRDNLKDNPELDELGIDYEYISGLMEEQDIIMDAILYYDKGDAYLEMFIRGIEINYGDFDELSDAEMEELSEKMADLIDRESGGIYESDKGMKFITFEFVDSGIYVMEYVTGVGDIGFDILFQSEYPFTDGEYEAMEIILDSLEFTPESKAEAEHRSLRDILGSIAL